MSQPLQYITRRPLQSRTPLPPDDIIDEAIRAGLRADPGFNTKCLTKFEHLPITHRKIGWGTIKQRYADEHGGNTLSKRIKEIKAEMGMENAAEKPQVPDYGAVANFADAFRAAHGGKCPRQPDKEFLPQGVKFWRTILLDMAEHGTTLVKSARHAADQARPNPPLAPRYNARDIFSVAARSVAGSTKGVDINFVGDIKEEAAVELSRAFAENAVAGVREYMRDKTAPRPASIMEFLEFSGLLEMKSNGRVVITTPEQARMLLEKHALENG